MNSILDRRAQVLAAFLEHFNSEPEFWCRAPGRVDLMGSHTDYNLGLVLTLPIGRDTWIAARHRDDRTVRVRSLNLGLEASFDLNALDRAPNRDWSNYARGVAVVLQQEGFETRGFDGVIHSTVPMSSGLSSSAALECATATVFERLGGWKLDVVEKALLCQRAENQFVGVNCGILDQYTSCAGQEGCALLLDCRAQCKEGARRLGVKALREISLERFNQRERELPAEVAMRCRFIVEENGRVLRLTAGLPAGDRSSIHRLCADSFRGAMTLYEIGAPAMQAMMEAMLAAPGVIGARQAGAGFGGCMVAFVEERQTHDFAVAVRAHYFATTNTEPEIYPVAAAAGAGVIHFNQPSSQRNDAARLAI
jgi:galactokinase